jgi:hydroxypyruvate isomerase
MPGREEEFAEACRAALPYAEALKPVNVNVLTGWPPESVDRSLCWATLAANLSHAGSVFERSGTRVLVEAVNGRDRPGYFLQHSRDAVRATRVGARRNLGIEYDIYHMQIMEGDLVPTMAELMDHIGHIQFADTPGRHEPGTGEINFPFVFDAVDRMGYEGWVGAEYTPTRRTEDTLGWLEPWKGRR